MLAMPLKAWVRHLCIVSVTVASVLSVRIDAKEVTYVYADPQGTVLARTDASGNIIESDNFSPYGRQVSGPSVNGPGYTGHVMDGDVALIYMAARYYDPDTARFLSRDPIPWKAGNMSSMNRFAYVGNNPLTLNDPTGQYICKGNTSSCDVIAGAVGQISKAANGLPEGSSDRTALQSISSFYGKPGEANGVTVQIAPIKNAMANAVTKDKETTITVDLAGIGNARSRFTPESQNTELVGTLAHEGFHGMSQLQKTPGDRDAVYADEQGAYRVQGTVNQGLGVTSIYGLWMQGDKSINQDAVDASANSSADRWCANGGNCP